MILTDLGICWRWVLQGHTCVSTAAAADPGSCWCSPYADWILSVLALPTDKCGRTIPSSWSLVYFIKWDPMFCISSCSTVAQGVRKNKLITEIFYMPTFYLAVRLHYANLFLEKDRKKSSASCWSKKSWESDQLLQIFFSPLSQKYQCGSVAISSPLF